MDARALSPDEHRRYSRHLLLPEIGLAGQQKLRASSVLIVGAGGLGSPLALYLAAAGVGRLGLVDFDRVDESNLHRQIIHGTSDVGRPKLDSAADTLKEINPNIEIQLFPIRLSSSNALEIFHGFDLVADGTDNFPTRYLVNDAAVLSGIPNVYASIFRFEGQVSVFGAPGGPCYRCLYPEPPPPGLVPSCAEGGVLGVLPGTIGTLQATEAIKQLLGIGASLVGRLLLYDALEMQFQTIDVPKNADCPVCGSHPTVTELMDYEQFCGVNAPPSQNAVPEITVTELKRRIDAGAAPFVLDVREPAEAEIATIEATLLPLGQLESRLDELAGYRHKEIVVHCRTGIRSADAVRILKRHGFSGAVNLTGGIRAWSEEIDSTVPVY
jgi:molybdopterin/thiamine biosynthesis adenylyltransferase/rhodanese-related sulfurtransferase